MDIKQKLIGYLRVFFFKRQTKRINVAALCLDLTLPNDPVEALRVVAEFLATLDQAMWPDVGDPRACRGFFVQIDYLYKLSWLAFETERVSRLSAVSPRHTSCVPDADNSAS